MEDELERSLRAVRETLLAEPVSPRVEQPADINLHYCRYVAETVVARLDDPEDLEILEDGGRGYAHTWLARGGRHYDAERPEGVADYRDLPFFRRHPEGAVGPPVRRAAARLARGAPVGVEPATADPGSLRARGLAPLYPAGSARDLTAGPDRPATPADLRYAVAGVVVGLLLVALGLSGEWALHHHLVPGPPGLRTLLVDVEVFGEVVALVSPVVFYLLRPAHRASRR